MQGGVRSCVSVRRLLAGWQAEHEARRHFGGGEGLEANRGLDPCGQPPPLSPFSAGLRGAFPSNHPILFPPLPIAYRPMPGFPWDDLGVAPPMPKKSVPLRSDPYPYRLGTPIGNAGPWELGIGLIFTHHSITAFRNGGS